MRTAAFLLLACLPLAAQSSDPASDLLNKGYKALRSDDPVGAIAYFEQARTLAPENGAVLRELGYLFWKSGRREDAVEAFEAALARDSSDLGTTLQLAYFYQSLGRLDLAEKAFRDVLRLDGSHEGARSALAALSGSPPPETAALERGYAALRQKDYDLAILSFRESLELQPDRPDVWKQLGYTLLRTGATDEAVQAFVQTVQRDPDDERAALELAFLRHETGDRSRALTSFRLLRESGDSSVSATARTAAEGVEAELGHGIERWERELAADPKNRSSWLELAELYERRAQPAEAASRYLEAWKLPGANREEILLRLAGARLAAEDQLGATGAWLLASRSTETRIAEMAQDSLPERHPYASEFRAALALDPRNTSLRRELAYLLLEVGWTEEAVVELETLVRQNPQDLQAAAQLAYLYIQAGRNDEAAKLLEKAAQDPELSKKTRSALDEVRREGARPHKELAEKSLQQSYLGDAAREFTRAYELNPEDLSSALKLGIVYNLLERDQEAVEWFRLASQSIDPQVRTQAERSYRALAPQFQRVTTTFWMNPLVSSRWRAGFGYAQLKTEIRVPGTRIRPYVSARFAGDVGQRAGGRAPQLLSESSMIAAVGLRAPLKRGVTAWGEAGQAISYLQDRPQGVPRSAPDYRGGVNWFRARGASLGSNEPGRFHETNVDAVYVSRFNDDVLFYGQYRPGYRLPNRGPLKVQAYLNFNITTDTQRAYWANYVEVGPGIRIRVPGVKPPMNFSLDWLRGVHLTNQGNLRGPNYFDLRASLWYSFSR